MSKHQRASLNDLFIISARVESLHFVSFYYFVFKINNLEAEKYI